MGREIRKVPKGWEHPRNEYGQYKPLYEEAYIDVLNEWWENHLLWQKGEHPDQIKKPEETKSYRYFAQWDGNPPDINYYNIEKWPVGCTVCFQIYETISEGTPASPVFDTLKDLENWLVETQGFEQEDAEEFCKAGWSPTFVGKHFDKNI